MYFDVCGVFVVVEYSLFLLMLYALEECGVGVWDVVIFVRFEMHEASSVCRGSMFIECIYITYV